MEKINVAELLKDCPKGMELDCILVSNPVKYNGLDDGVYLIDICTEDGNHFYLTKEGYLYNLPDSKCVIFPKGKTTWEGFVPPCEFKDGDILTTDLGSVFYLNTRLNTSEYYGCYVGIGGDGSFHICEPFAYKECCGFATKEERTRLFDTIKENGYEWNEKTKTLKKLVKPNFKVSDWVVNKFGDVWHIDSFNSEIYQVSNGDKYCYFLIEEQDKMHLWTIQDAKDGDVLVDKDNNIGIFQKFEGIYWYSYIYLGCDGELRGFSIGGSHKQTDVHPATKEQRDLLFQKIKEAGYYWNSETKTLEKLNIPKEEPIEDKGNISDGYHTFNELYEYRLLYNASMFNELAKQGLYDVHKSKKHSDGTIPFGDENWFIVQAELPTGQISNHYEMKDWDLFQVPVKEKANLYVGHTPQDVAKRLRMFLTSDKLIEPKFKVGDKVRHKNNHNVVFTITNIGEDYYACGTNKAFWFTEQDDYELVPKKFDITTLKPFDKVLVRDNSSGRWDITFYELYDNTNSCYPHRTLGGNIYKYCIPYEGNEHLLGKTDDCKDFYKNW